MFDFDFNESVKEERALSFQDRKFLAIVNSSIDLREDRHYEIPVFLPEIGQRIVHDEVHCSLVMAKSRVTPLKPITVPRLELAATVVSTNVSAFLWKELKYDFSEVFWTDSKVVL